MINLLRKLIRGLLGLPRRFKVESIVSIGHPDETRKPVAKNTLEYHKVSRNRYPSP